jgi:hypothetical protein
VNIDNYELTLVDLRNLGHKDDPWVLANHVTHVFYVLNLETGKHIVVSRKQKIVGVDNVKDNDEDINQFEVVGVDNVKDNDEDFNQFEEMPLFTNLINIKRIEKD